MHGAPGEGLMVCSLGSECSEVSQDRCSGLSSSTRSSEALHEIWAPLQESPPPLRYLLQDLVARNERLADCHHHLPRLCLHHLKLFYKLIGQLVTVNFFYFKELIAAIFYPNIKF